MGPRISPATPDVFILGAGVIGLSLALEIHSRGLRVAVADHGPAMAKASSAAAGMLAFEDPHNPRELRGLARLSASLYPAFLDRIRALSGLWVPFQTHSTRQYLADGSSLELQEHSLDPRQLAPALIGAVKAAGIPVLESSKTRPEAPFSPSDPAFEPEILVHTTGAWPCRDLPVFPRKGQMLRVAIPSGLRLEQVHRAEHIYVVPRTTGPQAGTALIGATVENAGFDTSTSRSALDQLRHAAAALTPGLADETHAPMLECWAGLRPATPDALPILGELEPQSRSNTREFVATGHFRNGILLAPATAVVLADAIQGRAPEVPLETFSPGRFACVRR